VIAEPAYDDRAPVFLCAKNAKNAKSAKKGKEDRKR
jgi:hypothetical protein